MVTLVQPWRLAVRAWGQGGWALRSGFHRCQMRWRVVRAVALQFSRGCRRRLLVAQAAVEPQFNGSMTADATEHARPAAPIGAAGPLSLTGNRLGH
jgi:hypothetical protein